MSYESRIRELEHKLSSEEDHIHWMVPDPSGGCRAPDPKDCNACVKSNFKLHYIISINLRTGKKMELPTDLLKT